MSNLASVNERYWRNSHKKKEKRGCYKFVCICTRGIVVPKLRDQLNAVSFISGSSVYWFIMLHEGCRLKVMCIFPDFFV